MRGAYDMIASLMGECSPLHMPTKLEILPRVGRPIAVSSSRLRVRHGSQLPAPPYRLDSRTLGHHATHPDVQ
jgi:hypothetical protein